MVGRDGSKKLLARWWLDGGGSGGGAKNEKCVHEKRKRDPTVICDLSSTILYISISRRFNQLILGHPHAHSLRQGKI